MANRYLLGLSGGGLLLLSQAASAAVVPSVIYENRDFVQGSLFSTEAIELTQSGEFELTLTDFNFGSQFENLMVTITTGTDTILSDEGEAFFIDYDDLEQYEGNNGVFSGTWTFEAGAGDYFLTLWADVGNSQDTDIGFYGVELAALQFDPVVTVPLPPALVFLGSALIPLAGYSRRKRSGS